MLRSRWLEYWLPQGLTAAPMLPFLSAAAVLMGNLFSKRKCKMRRDNLWEFCWTWVECPFKRIFGCASLSMKFRLISVWYQPFSSHSDWWLQSNKTCGCNYNIWAQEKTREWWIMAEFTGPMGSLCTIVYINQRLYNKDGRRVASPSQCTRAKLKSTFFSPLLVRPHAFPW